VTQHRSTQNLPRPAASRKRRQRRGLALGCGILLAFAPNALSQPLEIHTLAGRPIPGSAEGYGSNARFNNPAGVAADSTGNVFVADTWNGTVRRITPDGNVRTLAGLAGSWGANDGNGTNAQFCMPQGIAVDAAGALYVADTGNAAVRRISPAGTVDTFAGTPGDANSFDGTGTNAQFHHPEGVAVDRGGNIYVADTWNHTIRKIRPGGETTTLAGLAGCPGSADGTNSKARLNRPAGIAMDAGTNLFVTDSLNHTIRMITASGKTTTIAGMPGVWGHADGSNSAARFFQPQGIAIDAAGRIIVADSGNHTLRRITPSGTNWIVSTIAGVAGSAGYTNASGDAARFSFPASLAVDGAGYLYIADSANHLVRTTRVVPPTLRLKTAGNHLGLTWPTSSAGFIVQFSQGLGASETWSGLTNAVVDLGDNFAITIPVETAAGYYRLRQP